MSNNDKHKLFVKLALICGILAVIFFIICFFIKSFTVQFVFIVIFATLFTLTIIFVILFTTIYPKEKPNTPSINEIKDKIMWSHVYKEQIPTINNYCVIDIETTGLSRSNDQIIEISALRVRNDKITDTFTQLIKPTIFIPASATAINGITNEMVKNAPSLKEVIKNFVAFVGDDVVIGHNVSRFDIEFINRDCNNELGHPFNNNYIDTLLLARTTIIGVSNYKLSTLCRELGISQSTHRAEDDCISTKELYDKIKQCKSF